jgi:hypothetical protein
MGGTPLDTSAACDKHHVLCRAIPIIDAEPSQFRQLIDTDVLHWMFIAIGWLVLSGHRSACAPLKLIHLLIQT